MNGTLVYADVSKVDGAERLDDAHYIARIVETACIVGGATVLQISQHQFEPQGVTVVALLAESHVAVHTYPEERSYMVDVCTCGDTADAAAIARNIRDVLGGSGRLRFARRGRVN